MIAFHLASHTGFGLRRGLVILCKPHANDNAVLVQLAPIGNSRLIIITVAEMEGTSQSQTAIGHVW